MYEEFVKTLRSYGLTNGTTLGRHMGIMDEAADVIEKLESDLEEIMLKGGQNTDTCMYCAAADCYNRGGAGLCNPRWRGKKEAEGNDNE